MNSHRASHDPLQILITELKSIMNEEHWGMGSEMLGKEKGFFTLQFSPITMKR